eukprot:CAMPEP_0195108454 /NCGR_PEP_ID=MMETSP0448-20130528/85194_1 /TAXON_ID=66468 /ORGANISM="Heterocapsa triquestra, Strain CCMP 448" /LENGTH=94 /DNA_ID=CAMNT_0040144983 /DNA_START=79 /DNA_END=359 /DNA_ORIENTATION=-
MLLPGSAWRGDRSGGRRERAASELVPLLDLVQLRQQLVATPSARLAQGLLLLERRVQPWPVPAPLGQGRGRAWASIGLRIGRGVADQRVRRRAR